MQKLSDKSIKIISSILFILWAAFCYYIFFYEYIHYAFSLLIKIIRGI